MRSLVLLAITSVLCAGLQAQYQKVEIPSGVKFSSDATTEELKENPPRLVSTGTKNGVRYKISHLDAYGSVEGVKGGEMILGHFAPGADVWQLGCQRYPTADSKHCIVIRHGVTFVSSIGKSGPVIWLTATNGQLGSRRPSTIEVDGVTIFQDNIMATDAMERLREGKKATVRVAPDRNTSDWWIISFDLYGFSEAVELCNWAVKQIQ